MSSSAKRGFWCLTDEGKIFAASNVGPLSQGLVADLAFGYMDVRLKEATSTTGPIITPIKNDSAAETSSPEERLGSAVKEMRESVAADLLETLAKVSPTYFETIVLDLLHKMGYGANRNDLQRVGGSGDGGIDGVISLDKLGLEKVYVQAKVGKAVLVGQKFRAFTGL